MPSLIQTVAITNPFRWPYVRRGSERLLNDLTEYLNAQGYNIETYSMGPSDKTWKTENIVHHVLKSRFSSTKRQWNECHYFALALQKKLKHSTAQVVHCLNYFDAYAAIRARQKYKLKYKVVFHVVGIPTAKYFRAVPIDAYFFRKTLKYADAIWVLSQFAKEAIQQDFGVNCEVKPPPVAITTLDKPTHKKAPFPRTLAHPKLLFIGDCLEARKGVRALLKAMVIVKSTFPKAKLTLSGNINDAAISAFCEQGGIKEILSDLTFIGTGQVEDLPLLYSQADLTILPSVWEAFGLVVIESLAQGTPVIGCKHAGIVDIIQSKNVGRLFEPGNFHIETNNYQGIAEAIISSLNQLQTEDIFDDCVARAKDFCWQTLGAEYETRYREIVNE